MTEIIDACRRVLSLEAELNWSEASLGEAVTLGRVLGAFDGGRLVGFVLYLEVSMGTDEPEKGAEILCLATHPHFHGKGIMSRLIETLRSQVSEIWLEVHEANNLALTFYKNKGFQELGRRKRYYKDGGDALLFTWAKGKH
jgi:ribosomal-protein-alanine N-acetyltransferase